MTHPETFPGRRDVDERYPESLRPEAAVRECDEAAIELAETGASVQAGLAREAMRSGEVLKEIEESGSGGDGPEKHGVDPDQVYAANEPAGPVEFFNPKPDPGDAGAGNGNGEDGLHAGEANDPEDRDDSPDESARAERRDGQDRDAESAERSTELVRVTHEATFSGRRLNDLKIELAKTVLEENRQTEISRENLGEYLDQSPERRAELIAIGEATVDYGRSIGLDVTATVLGPEDFTFYDEEQFDAYYSREGVEDEIGTVRLGSYAPDINHARLLEQQAVAETLVTAQHESWHGASMVANKYHIKGASMVVVSTQNGLRSIVRPIDEPVRARLNPDVNLGVGPDDVYTYDMLTEHVTEKANRATISQEWPRHPELAGLVDEALGLDVHQGFSIETGREMTVAQIGNFIEDAIASTFKVELPLVERELQRSCISGDIGRVDYLLEQTFGTEGLLAVRGWQDSNDDRLLGRLEALFERRSGQTIARHGRSFVGDRMNIIERAKFESDLQEAIGYNRKPEYIGPHIEMTPERAAQVEAIRASSIDYAASIGAFIASTSPHPDGFTFFTREQYLTYLERIGTPAEEGDAGGYHPILDHSAVIEDESVAVTLHRTAYESYHAAAYVHTVWRHVYDAAADHHDWYPATTQLGAWIFDHPAHAGAEAGGEPAAVNSKFHMLNEYVKEAFVRDTMKQEWPRHPELAGQLAAALDHRPYEGRLSDGKQLTIMNAGGTILASMQQIHGETVNVRQELQRACLIGDVAKIESMLLYTFGQEGTDLIRKWEDVTDPEIEGRLIAIMQARYGDAANLWGW